MFKVMHIIPVADERDHDEGPGCWCGPSFQRCNGSHIWTHNAADMREEYERATGEAMRGKPWICVKDGVPIENDPY
jgi:hypothetical protein